MTASLDLGLLLSRAECLRAIVATECGSVHSKWLVDIAAVTSDIAELSTAIDTTSGALCDLDEDGDKPCNKETLKAIFDGDDAIAKNQVSPYEKQPGARVALSTDVCPQEFSEWAQDGEDLLNSIATHSDDLSFQAWIDTVRIPEECIEYRNFLDKQTTVTIPTAILAFDNSAIADVLYFLREGDEGASSADWSAGFYDNIFVPALDDGLAIQEGEYVVQEAYKTYCGDSPG